MGSARASWPLHDCASALASARDLCQCLGLCMGPVSVPWPLHGICASALTSAWYLCQCLGLCMGSVPVPWWPLHGICVMASGICASACMDLRVSAQCAHCTCCSIHRRGFVVVYSSNSFTSESALCSVFKLFNLMTDDN